MNVQSANYINPYIHKVNTGFDKTGKRIVTIAELYAESNFSDTLNSKIAEEDGKEIQRISFEGLEWHTPEFDESVQLGIDYARSCFDFTNSGDFDKLTAAEDFTGMSDAEIYKAIYEKYRHCYGENFYRTNYIKYLQPPADYNFYDPVLKRFDREVLSACGLGYESYDKLENIRKEALYGDMSDYDIRESVLDKYELSDGMSLRELYQISGELSALGLDGGIKGYLDLLLFDPISAADPRSSGSGTDTFMIREQQFDCNVTMNYINKLKKIYNNRCMYGQGQPDFNMTLSQILSKSMYT